MKVKTTITFEVVYPLDLEFYNTDKMKALEMEESYVAINPMEMIEAYEARGAGTFTTSVEAVDSEQDKIVRRNEIQRLLVYQWTFPAIAKELNLPLSTIETIATELMDGDKEKT